MYDEHKGQSWQGSTKKGQRKTMKAMRYRVLLRTTRGIEEYLEATRKDVEERFRLLLHNAPESYLYVEQQDSGVERGEYKAVRWCYLNEDLEKASKKSQDALRETLKQLLQEHEDNL